MATIPAPLERRLTALIGRIYPDQDAGDLVQRIVAAFWPGGEVPRASARAAGGTLWSQDDVMVITYGDTFTGSGQKPLDLLHDFLSRHLKDAITAVHILPFFPFTSDDGFSVSDYRAVNDALGDWPDVRRIAGEYRLMSDLVLNHVSGGSVWFRAYLEGRAPYDRFFFEASPGDDLSSVVRPRTSPLLREVETAGGTRHVWCTFSHDQVDLDFRNPEVLLEFLRIMRLHVDNGVRIIRLDAVAFIWKEIGTSCIHLPQTHAIVRLMRALCDFAGEPLVLLTETNVPNAENLSYFGDGDEAHAVYNFSLPPLLLHALQSGSAEFLIGWQREMPPPPEGCTYLNFTASHDGIGMRPAEGILPADERDRVIDAVRRFGGLVSMRALPGGGEAPYELNITYFDALRGTFDGPDEWQFERFLCSQTIALALQGFPAFYIHSLLGTPNDRDGVARTGINRAINRHRWDYDRLRGLLDDPASIHARVLAELKRRIVLRRAQPAFDPVALQRTLAPDPRLFAIRRHSPETGQEVLALHNVSKEDVVIAAETVALRDMRDCTDLLRGETLAGGDIAFGPYQCRWIARRAAA